MSDNNACWWPLIDLAGAGGVNTRRKRKSIAALEIEAGGAPLTLPSPPVGERVAKGRVRGFRGSKRELSVRGILFPFEAEREELFSLGGLPMCCGRKAFAARLPCPLVDQLVSPIGHVQ